MWGRNTSVAAVSSGKNSVYFTWQKSRTSPQRSGSETLLGSFGVLFRTFSKKGLTSRLEIPPLWTLFSDFLWPDHLSKEREGVWTESRLLPCKISWTLPSLSGRHVLTAAHCVAGLSQAQASKLVVRLGRHHVHQSQAQDGQRHHTLEQIRLSHQYRDQGCRLYVFLMHLLAKNVCTLISDLDFWGREYYKSPPTTGSLSTDKKS